EGVFATGPSRLHSTPHAERGKNRTPSVILLSNRCAEQRHEPVPEELVDRPAVAVDLPKPLCEEAVQQTVKHLGAATLGHAGRAHDVAEHDGALTVFPLGFRQWRLRGRLR